MAAWPPLSGLMYHTSVVLSLLPPQAVSTPAAVASAASDAERRRRRAARGLGLPREPMGRFMTDSPPEVRVNYVTSSPFRRWTQELTSSGPCGTGVTCSPPKGPVTPGSGAVNGVHQRLEELCRHVVAHALDEQELRAWHGGGGRASSRDVHHLVGEAVHDQRRHPYG